MPVYVVGQLNIRDPLRYEEYLAGFMPSFIRHGGQLLAVSSGQTEVLEGNWEHPRTVIMRFPDKDAARAWYDDPDYRELARIRHRTADTNLVIVDGLETPSFGDGT